VSSHNLQIHGRGLRLAAAFRLRSARWWRCRIWELD
jgi:hypothetical protein